MRFGNDVGACSLQKVTMQNFASIGACADSDMLASLPLLLSLQLVLKGPGLGPGNVLMLCWP